MTKKPTDTQLTAWRLFLTASAKLVDKIDAKLRAADQIPLNWYDVLIELHEAPGKRLRMSELADRVLLTRSGLTRLVDRLEKAGYITRELDPEDRRGFYAVITPDGVGAMRTAWPVYRAGIDEGFAQHLDEAEAEILAKAFQRMLDAGSKVDGSP